MTITYTWEITEISTTDTPDLKNVVVQTRWKKIGTDENGNTGFFAGATPFKPNLVASDSFVPFEQLTEDVVLGWIKETVVNTYETHVNNQIRENIKSKGIHITPMPWVDPTAVDEV